ncbi:hypothetical protein DFA_08483 [Cavenderia fasciculata]|uniref:F-box domain-containing protein n=1 Tax=Cavenderia fasciculata TaxID=261658 RepID=F4Q2M0_CACFS|nr:uncharacterized protein DFA_08483 [Cavenderia fasciculata]EGG17487.1 hypothetical protein DFA_08483 [Cavenderia fasciculata]|eukprot:XP_004355971.1 hypothetical protein DFA_08483 [Cavenderia fasciculata]
MSTTTTTTTRILTLPHHIVKEIIKDELRQTRKRSMVMGLVCRKWFEWITDMYNSYHNGRSVFSPVIYNLNTSASSSSSTATTTTTIIKNDYWSYFPHLLNPFCMLKSIFCFRLTNSLDSSQSSSSSLSSSSSSTLINNNNNVNSNNNNNINNYTNSELEFVYKCMFERLCQIEVMNLHESMNIQAQRMVNTMAKYHQTQTLSLSIQSCPTSMTFQEVVVPLRRFLRTLWVSLDSITINEAKIIGSFIRECPHMEEKTLIAGGVLNLDQQGGGQQQPHSILTQFIESIGLHTTINLFSFDIRYGDFEVQAPRFAHFPNLKYLTVTKTAGWSRQQLEQLSVSCPSISYLGSRDLSVEVLPVLSKLPCLSTIGLFLPHSSPIYQQLQLQPNSIQLPANLDRLEVLVETQEHISSFFKSFSHRPLDNPHTSLTHLEIRAVELNELVPTVDLGDLSIFVNFCTKLKTLKIHGYFHQRISGMERLYQSLHQNQSLEHLIIDFPCSSVEEVLELFELLTVNNCISRLTLMCFSFRAYHLSVSAEHSLSTRCSKKRAWFCNITSFFVAVEPSPPQN